MNEGKAIRKELRLQVIHEKGQVGPRRPEPNPNYILPHSRKREDLRIALKAIASHYRRDNPRGFWSTGRPLQTRLMPLYAAQDAGKGWALLPDEPVPPGHPGAARLGWTSEWWHPMSYIYREGKQVYLSVVIALHPGHGHFSELVERLLASGLTVKVPSPSAELRSILRHLRFRPSVEEDELHGEVWVWVRHPKRRRG